MSTPADRPVPSQGAPGQGAPAFSRPLDVDDVPDDGLAMTIEADAAECLAIAEQIDLPAVGALAAKCRVTRLYGGRVQVEGTLHARITQVCVVSLEPFESEISPPIAMTFAPVKPALSERHARQRTGRDVLRRAAEMEKAPPPVIVSEGEADPPDPIVDGRIDLGVVAVEFLTLALDFYPKKPGVHFNDVLIGETDEPKPSAFSALERFKDGS